jgi:hypothetical protein
LRVFLRGRRNLNPYCVCCRFGLMFDDEGCSLRLYLVEV